MKVLVVYCHPCAESFNAAVRDVAVEALEKRGHDVRLIDLYAAGFDPVMRMQEWRGYFKDGENLEPVRDQAQHVAWAEAVVFIYPTWWYGLPAMLKGWLERVLVPGFAFDMPAEGRGPRPRLQHIGRLMALTTCGATPLVSWIMGQPGRRTLLRGFRSICNPVCRTKYLALYNMDTISEAKRLAHLERVRRTIASFAA
jgi:NAD(P)H dehydrogenase (quinone)